MTINNQKQITEMISKMTIEEARTAIANGNFGNPESMSYLFASGLLSTREAELRDKREEETLTISRSALQASEEANKLARDANSIALNARSDARKANIIAISAVIIAIAAIITQILLIKN